MDYNLEHIQNLVSRPSENLSVELKNWIDLDTPEGIQKVIKAVFALRNYNGGYLVIGFKDRTLEPDNENIPANVVVSYHSDKIHALISKYASEPFEVDVQYPEREYYTYPVVVPPAGVKSDIQHKERNSQIFPVVIVPAGVKTPVVVKSDLKEKSKNLLSVGDVFVRTLKSNNTPSSSKLAVKDWATLLETCFDNREANVGRFIRRHLSGLNSETINNLSDVIGEKVESPATKEDDLTKFIDNKLERFKSAVLEHDVNKPNYGAWEVGLIIEGECSKHNPDRMFLRLLDSSNPNYTGWPIWLDSSPMPSPNARPKVKNREWESLVACFGEEEYRSLDFMTFGPEGRFYLYRAFEEDFKVNQSNSNFMVLDFVIRILRTAEAIGVGLAFAKAMGFNNDAELNFAFRWTELKDRLLTTFSPFQNFMYENRAYENEVTTFVTVPIDTSLAALSNYVNPAVQPLFNVFNGSKIEYTVIDNITSKLVNRQPLR